jgi:SAM-dependent methyltransferase
MRAPLWTVSSALIVSLLSAPLTARAEPAAPAGGAQEAPMPKKHEQHHQRAAQGEQAEHGAHGAHGAHRGHEEGAHKGHHHSFDDPARYVERWEGPKRDAEQRPAEVLSFCGVRPGHTAVDLGAGTGYFVPHLARAVGEQGRVLALDVEPKMVEWLVARVAREGLTRAEARLAAPADPGLAPSSVDVVLVVNVWHHIDDRPAYLARLASALRPGGRLCLVEIKPEAPFGPPAAHRLTPAALKQELSSSTALVVGEEVLDLEHQYVVVATLRP